MFNDETCLAFACARGFHLLVRYLITQAKVDVNPKVDWNGGTPILYAIQEGQHKIVQELIDRGSKLEECGDFDAYELAILLQHQPTIDVMVDISLK